MGQEVEYSVLIDSFKSTRLDEQMIALVQELKEKYLIGMITDNKCDRITTILDDRGLHSYFDVVAISASIHSGKDSRRIFEYALEALKVNASECVFIDNTEKNLLIPQQMGMNTILFDDESRDFPSFKRKLESILL